MTQVVEGSPLTVAGAAADSARASPHSLLIPVGEPSLSLLQLRFRSSMTVSDEPLAVLLKAHSFPLSKRQLVKEFSARLLVSLNLWPGDAADHAGVDHRPIIQRRQIRNLLDPVRADH